MHIVWIVAAFIFAPIYVWIIVKLKLKDIERRNKREAPTELHLNE